VATFGHLRISKLPQVILARLVLLASCFVFGLEWVWWITNDSERWKVMMQRDVACVLLHFTLRRGVVLLCFWWITSYNYIRKKL